MKSLTTTALFLFFTINSFGQEKTIETKSLLLDDFISFIADNYSASNQVINVDELNDDDDDDDDDEIIRENKNLTFLIESSRNNPSQEDITSLKQSFKFLSKRLSENDNISIVAYSGLNGLVLEKTNPKNLKKILNALDDFKAQIDKECKDGISYAYEYANKSHDEVADNVIVMLRNPKPTNYTTTDILTTSSNQDNKVKRSGGAIILTAITLLPELIAVIKN